MSIIEDKFHVVVGLLFFVVLFVTLAVFSGDRRAYLSARNSVHWPSTSGILTARGYRYTVDGKEYESDGDASGVTELDAPIAFLANSSVTVFYNPQEPSLSVRRPGIHGGWINYFGPSVLLLVPSIALLVWLIWMLFFREGKPIGLDVDPVGEYLGRTRGHPPSD